MPGLRQYPIQDAALLSAVADVHQHVEQDKAPDVPFRVRDLVEARERVARAKEVAGRRQHQAEPFGIVRRDQLDGEKRAQQALFAVEWPSSR